MKILKLFIWATVHLHIQILLPFLVFYYLPASFFGKFANELAFFAILILFVLNFMVSYFVALVWLREDVELITDNHLLLTVLGLSGLVFSPLAGGSYLSYLNYKQASIKTVTINKRGITPQGNFFRLASARILNDYTWEKRMEHSSTAYKTNHTTYHSVHYKLCPVVPQDWVKGDEITTFLAYNTRENIIKDFDFSFVITKADSEGYLSRYRKLSKELSEKHNLKTTKEPIYLNMIDIEKYTNSALWYAKLYYYIIFGGLFLAIMPYFWVKK